MESELLLVKASLKYSPVIVNKTWLLVKWEIHTYRMSIFKFLHQQVSTGKEFLKKNKALLNGVPKLWIVSNGQFWWHHTLILDNVDILFIMSMKGLDVALDGCSPSWTSSGQRRVKSWIIVENFHNDVFHLQPLDKEFLRENIEMCYWSNCNLINERVWLGTWTCEEHIIPLVLYSQWACIKETYFNTNNKVQHSNLKSIH